MIFVYVLAIYNFKYGFIYDHVEVYKTKSQCEKSGKNLPKGQYPNFEIINDKATIVCQKVRIK